MVTSTYLRALIAHAQKALNIDSKNAEIYQRLGDLYAVQQEFEKASYYYIEAIKLKPSPSSCFYRLKFALQAMNWLGGCSNPQLIEDGVLTLHQVVQKIPDFHFSKVVLGELLAQQGKIEDAISCYTSASYHQTLSSYPQLVKDSWREDYSRKPDFLVVGFPKCGTTSLYGYLASHPEILPPITKEVRCRTLSTSQDLDMYLAHFPRIVDKDYLTFEATPLSATQPVFLRDVSKHMPNIKLIVLLRNPVDRSVSNFYHVQRSFPHRSTQPLETAAEKLLNQPDLISNMLFSLEVSLRKPEVLMRILECYPSKESTSMLNQLNIVKAISELEITSEELDSLIKIVEFYKDKEARQDNQNLLMASMIGSFYLYYLKSWMHYFSQEQVLILESEDLFRKPAETMKKVYGFLGLATHTLPQYHVLNPNTYPAISDNCRYQIAETFRPYNKKLEDYLNMQFKW
jgi:tetratricopeptide (TPR) repeat protein